MDAAIHGGCPCRGLFSSTPGDAPYAPNVTSVSTTLIINPKCPHGCSVGLMSPFFSSCDCESIRFSHPISGWLIIAPCLADTDQARHSVSVVEAVGSPHIIRPLRATNKSIDLLPTGHAGYKYTPPCRSAGSRLRLPRRRQTSTRRGGGTHP